jgi:hypothetical protein
MTGAAQARGLRRARKLRALRLISARTATVDQEPDRRPLTADEVRQLWLSWGGIHLVHRGVAADQQRSALR